MPSRGSGVPGLVCPAVVAHRGASARYPENTLAAFEAAIRAGADMVELDVRLTSDGVPVVIHDPDVATTTDGSGLVHELDLTQVRALRAGQGPARSASVPTLREALTLLRGRAAVEIDIKNDPAEPGFDEKHTVAGEVSKLVTELGFQAALLSSTNPETVGWVRRHDPGAVTGVELEGDENLWDWIDYSATRGHAFLLPNAEAVLSSGRDFVESAHARGIRIGAWTVDDPETMSELFAWGVDAVETNDPDMAAPIRDRARQRCGAGSQRGDSV